MGAVALRGSIGFSGTVDGLEAGVILVEVGSFFAVSLAAACAGFARGVDTLKLSTIGLGEAVLIMGVLKVGMSSSRSTRSVKLSSAGR